MFILPTLQNTIPGFSESLYTLFAIIVASVAIFLITGIPLFIFIANSFRKNKVLPHGEKKYRYAILIPARNESDVICNSLNSILKQDYDHNYFDVYVIVESEDDPTCQLTRERGFNVFVRKNLENRRTKGYALDECIQYINTTDKEYDAYVIFDADNVLEPSYMTKLNDIKNLGYDLGVGDRLFTNAEESWVSACSATLFAYMSKVTCKARSKFFHKVTLMGAGYYINKKIVDDAGGFIWNDLSEDSQLTNYCYYHNLNCYYYSLAKYYDEQPIHYKVLHRQHIRWVWGYIKAGNKKTNDLIYNKEHLSRFKLGKFEVSTTLFPFLMFTVATLVHCVMAGILFISSCCLTYNNPDTTIQFFNIIEHPIWLTFYYFLFSMFIVWLPWMIIPIIIFTIDKQNISWSARTKAKVCLTYFFFFMDFGLAFADGLFFPKKRRAWKKIAHSGSITCASAINNANNNNKQSNEKETKDEKDIVEKKVSSDSFEDKNIIEDTAVSSIITDPEVEEGTTHES